MSAASLFEGEGSGDARMARDDGRMDPVEGVRTQSSGNEEESRWSVVRWMFYGLPLADSIF